MRTVIFSRVEEGAFKDGYRVTDDGRLISKSGRQMTPGIRGGGYPFFRVGKYGGCCSVHRLAGFQKFGIAIYEPGIEVRHLDGNKLNFSMSNLALGTATQNAQDKSPEVRLSAALNASRHVIKHDAAAVRAHYELSASYKLTMAHFGITSKGTLHYLLNGRQQAIAA
jgi:hypothetical protein